MSELALHGQPSDHAELISGSYESPEEYADQGDTRVVRDLMFGYTIETKDAAGNSMISATEAHRGDPLNTDQIGLIALRKGESNHSFYTTEELDKIRNPLPAEAVASGVTLDNLSEQGEYELADWLATPSQETGQKPTINEVLEAVGDDKELAHRMLQAENIHTDGDPRKGLEAGLTDIIRA